MFDLSFGAGRSDSSGLSDSGEQDASGERLDEFVSVGENAELLVSGEAILEVGREVSSLFSRGGGEPYGLGSALNEKTKGWTAGGSLSRVRFVTGLCSYTQSDPPSSLTHGVQGCFASHLCSPSSRWNKPYMSMDKGTRLTRFLLLTSRTRRRMLDQWLCPPVEIF